jgi:hypothetical protein
MGTLLRAAAALVLVGTAPVVNAPAASALSCVDPAEWYPDAAHVFVAHVADVDGSRIAFDVREVWQGEDLAERVWLRRAQGMDMWYPFSSQGEVEDGYSSPVEYVVAVQDDLVVGPCGLAPLDDSGYGVPGAEAPRAPVSGGADGQAPVAGTGEEGVEPESSMAPPLAAGGAGVVGAGVLAALWWRRRRA